MPRMRKTTKRKGWGKAQLVVGLRCAIEALERGRAAGDGALPAAVDEALASLRRGAQAMDIYGLDRKRVRAALEREISHLEALKDEAAAIPVTAEEKAIAAHDRQRARATGERPAAPSPGPVAVGRPATVPSTKRLRAAPAGARKRPARVTKAGKKGRRARISAGARR